MSLIMKYFFSQSFFKKKNQEKFKSYSPTPQYLCSKSSKLCSELGGAWSALSPQHQLGLYRIQGQKNLNKISQSHHLCYRFTVPGDVCWNDQGLCGRCVIAANERIVIFPASQVRQRCRVYQQAPYHQHVFQITMFQPALFKPRRGELVLLAAFSIS